MNGICSLLNTGCEYVWLLIHPFLSLLTYCGHYTNRPM